MMILRFFIFFNCILTLQTNAAERRSYHFGTGFLHSTTKFTDEADPRSYPAANFYSNGMYLSFDYVKNNSVNLFTNVSYGFGEHKYSSSVSYNSRMYSIFYGLGYNFQVCPDLSFTPYLGNSDQFISYTKKLSTSNINAFNLFEIRSLFLGIRAEYQLTSLIQIGVNSGIQMLYQFRKKYENATNGSLDFDENYAVKNKPQLFIEAPLIYSWSDDFAIQGSVGYFKRDIDGDKAEKFLYWADMWHIKLGIILKV